MESYFNIEVKYINYLWDMYWLTINNKVNNTDNLTFYQTGTLVCYTQVKKENAVVEGQRSKRINLHSLEESGVLT